MTSPPLPPSLTTSPCPYWQRRGLAACMLWPLSLVFGAISTVRRWWLTRMQTPWRAPVPVVIVGNITAGGAGKTPTVIALIEHFQRAGHKPGVISRGYGRQTSPANPCLQVLASSTPAQAGDEPLLIQRRTGVPVFVAANRAQAAQALLAQYPDTTLLISDDGLQHYALARDVEIAVFDDRGIGNGWLLPAGPLREPLSRARQVDLVLYNASMHPAALASLPGYKAQRQLTRYLPLADWAACMSTSASATTPQAWLPLNQLAAHSPNENIAESIAAVAGIGHPQRFFDMLTQAGIVLQQTCPLPDHSTFSASTLDTIHAKVILITEKDAPKCLTLPQQVQARLYVVPLQYMPEPEFFKQLDALILPHTR